MNSNIFWVTIYQKGAVALRQSKNRKSPTDSRRNACALKSLSGWPLPVLLYLSSADIPPQNKISGFEKPEICGKIKYDQKPNLTEKLYFKSE